jgi:hypothetical protein
VGIDGVIILGVLSCCHQSVSFRIHLNELEVENLVGNEVNGTASLDVAGGRYDTEIR